MRDKLSRFTPKIPHNYPGYFKLRAVLSTRSCDMISQIATRYTQSFPDISAAVTQEQAQLDYPVGVCCAHLSHSRPIHDRVTGWATRRVQTKRPAGQAQIPKHRPHVAYSILLYLKTKMLTCEVISTTEAVTIRTE